MIRRLLIVNRGEIALRIVRAARELGLVSIVAHSDADVDTLAVHQADEAVCIGPAQAAKSYLNIPAVIEAARNCQADAVHPGYGFLSESPEFARAVKDAGLIFIGPDADIIDRMGDKAMARQTAIEAGVPVVPGSPHAVEGLEEALSVAEDVGYPLLIKAAAGGGGRGIRVAEDAEMLTKQLPLAKSEAQSAFGDGRVYLERFIARARHIEVQVLGDGKRAVHFFERECSLQRRRQKMFEEAPSPAIDSTIRKRLCESAVALAEHVGYLGAGTLEYLFDEKTGEFFFIEMNTRIQVEHPVTEMVTGFDLVRAMIQVAAGEPLSIAQNDITLRGWAIEMRINAEDPDHDFFPSLGTVKKLVWPTGPGVRIDSGLYEGYKMPPFYDSLVAKLIVWDDSREHALTRAGRALDEFQLQGFTTTAGLHRRLIEDSAVKAGAFDTVFLERWLAEPASNHANVKEVINEQ
ncbi:acetyl-CoA carboxylase biotin carboxylase subunit [Vreelandella maris]|uniref:Biotin carboxylase n=1 Tax=Vreelandella maris TaxID=2729617 RepID=A0A7Y6REL8_9GAMM|nr:acetyl-CoA carboxylase biotin carboxylase subunit [Halomonas maris]NVF15535.1 acetyl-CoA carboxylase biotin carboxylase subunit [Halomonas maris]|tara:strand:+ start:4099 stop:5487 length:1389 start_codon:yes stop_codon:yes gene_type:complete